jgi:hypothetical protein
MTKVSYFGPGLRRDSQFACSGSSGAKNLNDLEREKSGAAFCELWIMQAIRVGYRTRQPAIGSGVSSSFVRLSSKPVSEFCTSERPFLNPYLESESLS